MKNPAWVERERSTGMLLSDVTALTVQFPSVRLPCFPHGGQQRAAAVGDAAHRTTTTACPRSPRFRGAVPAVEHGRGRVAAGGAAAGPLPPLFTSDEPWLGVCLGGESLRAAFLRTPHWRTLPVGARQAGSRSRVDTPPTSSWQVRGGGGGACGSIAAATTHTCACAHSCRCVCGRHAVASVRAGRRAATLAARAR
jgi:hypothetical protein